MIVSLQTENYGIESSFILVSFILSLAGKSHEAEGLMASFWHNALQTLEYDALLTCDRKTTRGT